MDPNVCVRMGLSERTRQQGANWCWTGSESGMGVGFRRGTESGGFMLSTPASHELVDILPKMV